MFFSGEMPDEAGMGQAVELLPPFHFLYACQKSLPGTCLN